MKPPTQCALRHPTPDRATIGPDAYNMVRRFIRYDTRATPLAPHLSTAADFKLRHYLIAAPIIGVKALVANRSRPVTVTSTVRALNAFLEPTPYKATRIVSDVIFPQARLESRHLLRR